MSRPFCFLICVITLFTIVAANANATEIVFSECSDDVAILEAAYAPHMPKPDDRRPVKTVSVHVAADQNVDLPRQVKIGGNDDPRVLPPLPCSSDLSWYFRGIIETMDGLYVYELYRQVENNIAEVDQAFFAERRASGKARLYDEDPRLLSFEHDGMRTGLVFESLGDTPKTLIEIAPYSRTLWAEMDTNHPCKSEATREAIKNEVLKHYPLPSIVRGEQKLIFGCRKVFEDQYNAGKFIADYKVHLEGEVIVKGAKEGEFDCSDIDMSNLDDVIQAHRRVELSQYYEDVELRCHGTIYRQEHNWTEFLFSIHRK